MNDGIALASVEDLKARLAFDLTPEEEREAAGALTDLSDEARAHGRASWLTPESAPQSVKNLILRAASRHMKNYEGFVMSRAGDEYLQWSDLKEKAGAAYFTEAEVTAIKRMSGQSRLHSVGMFAWTANADVEEDIYVRTESGSTIQFWSSKDPGAPRTNRVVMR